MTIFSKKNTLTQIFHSINLNYCPICDSKLNYEDQNDSIYITCNRNLNHFDISGFKDLSSGELILIYLDNNNEGIVNVPVLREFQNIISRKLYHIKNDEKK